jgi:hypothetical protein
MEGIDMEKLMASVMPPEEETSAPTKGDAQIKLTDQERDEFDSITYVQFMKHRMILKGGSK